MLELDTTKQSRQPLHGRASDHTPIRIALPEQQVARDAILKQAEQYVRRHRLTPPLSMEELNHHTGALLAESRVDPVHHDLLTVLINNAVWADTIASVPYERRLLLIPQCLRSAENCEAQMDEFGLLCEQCGNCQIGTFQEAAESLGYVVLIAEGTTVVTKLLESGKVDAVVGVSCLAVLERTFPHMAADAIPGIAIPLMHDGCRNTRIEENWLMKAIHLKSEARWLGQAEMNRLRDDVRAWFGRDALAAVMGPSRTRSHDVAAGWVAQAGKRWRPFLLTAVFRSLRGDNDEIPAWVQQVAVAVECFHKASLVHDDIEDDDDLRYGEPALHCRHGVPVALNTGDLLVGEGYRLIAGCGIDADRLCRLLSVAAEGHHTLCLGQGEELFCMRDDLPPSTRKVLEVFEHKTSPAFAVALRLGGLCADADARTDEVLRQYSRSLGIAYQIRDDLDDYVSALATGDAAQVRPSLLLALAMEAADADTRRTLTAAWRDRTMDAAMLGAIDTLGVADKARQLCEHYKLEAIRCLAGIESAPLKSFLRRVIGKILGKARE